MRPSKEATNILAQLASIAAVHELVNVSVEACKLSLECLPMEKPLKTFGAIGRVSLGRVLGLGMTRAVNKRVLSRHDLKSDEKMTMKLELIVENRLAFPCASLQ